MALRDDGRSDFGALLTKRGGAQASLIGFDLLRLDGNDLRLRPIEERRSAVLRLVVGVSGILFSETLAAEGPVVFAKACELGLEGCRSGRAAFIKAGKAAIVSRPRTRISPGRDRQCPARGIGHRAIRFNGPSTIPRHCLVRQCSRTLKPRFCRSPGR